jgi:hypothetical protein
MLRKAGFTLCVLAVLTFSGLYGLRAYIIHKADKQAEEILSGSSVSSSVALSLHATEKLYKSFSKNGYKSHLVLARLRPYLSNERLPEFIRIQKGAIPLMTMEGWCDDAARALIYTLSRRSIEGKQWNIQGASNAHVAVLVQFGAEQTALLDPYYGYHTVKNGAAVSPGNAVKENAFIPLDENSNRLFYARYDTYFTGVQGAPLRMSWNIPLTEKTLVLGEKNGDSTDAHDQMKNHGMGVASEYLGHKYDRGWTRELVAQQPLQIDIILTKEPDDGVLRTLSPPPAVDGAKLTWLLSKNQKITSEDGKAGISWTRLNSYIDIDQVIITPRGDKS